MIVSLQINDSELSAFAEKVAEARDLYGVDSAYLIGMVNAFEMLLGKAENADEAKRRICSGVKSRDGRSANPSGKSAPQGGQDKAGPLAENTWIRGAVKWFNNDKGYGFISTEGNVDVFVHWRDISSWERSIGQGEEVEFMVTKTAKGFQAVNVMKVGRPENDSPPSEEGTAEEVEASAADVGRASTSGATADGEPPEVSPQTEGPTPPERSGAASDADGEAAASDDAATATASGERS